MLSRKESHDASRLTPHNLTRMSSPRRNPFRNILSHKERDDTSRSPAKIYSHPFWPVSSPDFTIGPPAVLYKRETGTTHVERKIFGAAGEETHFLTIKDNYDWLAGKIKAKHSEEENLAKPEPVAGASISRAPAIMSDEQRQQAQDSSDLLDFFGITSVETEALLPGRTLFEELLDADRDDVYSATPLIQNETVIESGRYPPAFEESFGEESRCMSWLPSKKNTPKSLQKQEEKKERKTGFLWLLIARIRKRIGRKQHVQETTSSKDIPLQRLEAVVEMGPSLPFEENLYNASPLPFRRQNPPLL